MHWCNEGNQAMVLIMVALSVAGYSNATLDNSTTSAISSHYKNYSRLLRKLLEEGYDRRIRPGKKAVPVIVKVDMYISNIWAIKEVNMDFTIDIYLRQYWNDERLQHNRMSSDSVLTLSSDINKQIWVPSTYFIGTKKAYFHDVTTDNYLLQVRPNGNIFYGMRLTITTSCQMDLRDFPHDTQECTLSLESYGYQTTDVIYEWNNRNDNTSAIVLHNNLELPQFEVVEVTKSVKTNMYNIGNHSALVAIFKMKRRIGYFLIDTYIPSTIIVIISWISFWIDPETAPARVALGITTVLTMTTLISSARANLPKVSYVKAIDWYLLLCLIFVFGSILEYTCITFVIANRKRAKKKMEMLRGSMNRSSNKETKPEIHFGDTVPTCRIHSKTGSTKVTSVMTRVFGEDKHISTGTGTCNRDYEGGLLFHFNPSIIDNASRLLFPLSFVGFNVIYWMVYGS